MFVTSSLKVWGPFLCCGNSTKAVPNKKNSQLLYVKSLWKAAVSDFRDVIETQVQRFQGNVGLQLTGFNAADPVVMPETVRRRKRDYLVLLEKQKEYPRLQQAPRLAPSLYAQSYGDFSTAVWGETHSRETFPNPFAAPLARDQLTGICRLPDTFFLLQNHWLHSSVFLPLIWACSPTSLHFQTGFVTCKDYRAVFESQRQGVQISGLTNPPRLHPENGSFRERNK